MKKVTVKDIARRSGYSVSTVSKTLNGTDRVGAEAMEKIRRIASEMGYRSNLSAQSLVRGTRKIAIVLFANPIEVRSMFEEGFTRAFSIYGEFGLRPEYHYFSRKSGLEGVDWDAVTENAQGVVVIASYASEECLQKLDTIGKRMPLVFLQSMGQQLQKITHRAVVAVDAMGVGAMAAEVLALTLPPGSQVAMITDGRGSWIHDNNESGFCDAACRMGLSVVDVRACASDMDLAGEQTGVLLQRFPDLAGIFASPYVSPAVCDAAAAYNRALKVVGVDLFQESIACLRSGRLTAAIFQNQQQQAFLALETVVRSLQGETTHTEILIKPELVLRANLPHYLEKESTER